MVKFDISLWNILTSARKSSKCFKFYWENQRCVDSRCSLEPFLMRLIGFGSSSGYSTSCYLGNLSSCCLDLFSTLLGKYLVLKIDVFVLFRFYWWPYLLLIHMLAVTSEAEPELGISTSYWDVSWLVFEKSKMCSLVLSVNTVFPNRYESHIFSLVMFQLLPTCSIWKGWGMI